MAADPVEEIYLDNNATTIPLPTVRQGIWDAMGPAFGNPSSVHSAGDRARAQLREAREQVAALVGCDPERLLFTSGATEANNHVLQAVPGLKAQMGKRHVITTAVEHSSVLRTCEYLQGVGIDVDFLRPNEHGQISISEVERRLRPETVLVSLQWVNNETGTVLPVQDLGAFCRSRGVLFHTDAAQAVGKTRVHLANLPIDALSFTAHKFHGPQGIGALYLREGCELKPLLFGGAQEQGGRAGTENVPGIVGFGIAAKARIQGLDHAIQHMRMLRDRFESAVLSALPFVRVNGDAERRVCNTSNLLFQGVDGQALVVRLDQAGIRCSQSSACTNQRPEPSYVLRAMGLSEEDAYSSVRFGFSEFNTREEVDKTVHTLVGICEQLRSFSALRN